MKRRAATDLNPRKNGGGGRIDVAPGSRDWSSRGKRRGKLWWWRDQNLSYVYHVRNNG
jgi:hypothetical protein